MQPVVKPVVQPVWKPAVSCKQTSNRLFVKPGCTTGLTTGCMHDTTGCQRVWQPVWQQVVSCKRGLSFLLSKIVWLKRYTLCYYEMLCNEALFYYSWLKWAMFIVKVMRYMECDITIGLQCWHFGPARQWSELLQLNLLKYQYSNNLSLPTYGPDSIPETQKCSPWGNSHGWKAVIYTELSIYSSVVICTWLCVEKPAIRPVTSEGIGETGGVGNWGVVIARPVWGLQPEARRSEAWVSFLRRDSKPPSLARTSGERCKSQIPFR